MLAMERLVDLAAREHGFDPVELRRRNLIPTSGDAVPDGARAHLRQRRLSAGDGARAAGSPTGTGSRHAAPRRARGAGCAASGSPTRSRSPRASPSNVPRSRCDPRARVDVTIGTLSSGQGHATAFAQCVADWLGVPFDGVRLITGDNRCGSGRRRIALRPLDADGRDRDGPRLRAGDRKRQANRGRPAGSGGRGRGIQGGTVRDPRHRPERHAVRGRRGRDGARRHAVRGTHGEDERAGLPLRHPGVRGGDRPRDRRRRRGALRRRRRRGPRGQPDDPARPGAWRDRPGGGSGAVRARPLRSRTPDRCWPAR